RILSGRADRNGAVEARAAGYLDAFVRSDRYAAVDRAVDGLRERTVAVSQSDRAADCQSQRLAPNDGVAMCARCAVMGAHVQIPGRSDVRLVYCCVMGCRICHAKS